MSTPSQHPSPLWLPPDGPLDSQGLKQFDGYRLQPAIDALYKCLDEWLNLPYKQRTSSAPRIGVFGGLGQGKSTVMLNVIERIQHERGLRQRIHEFLLGPRMIRFDISYFKADDLEWRFLTAVLWPRLLRNLIVLTLFAFVLSCLVRSVYCFSDGQLVLPCTGAVISNERHLLLALVSLPLLLSLKSLGIRVFSIFKAVNPSKDLNPAKTDLYMQLFADLLPALPDIVFVDDLDRATVDQQRRFLRAILRFSRILRFAVVVCMDESELLAAPPNPEAPEELLRKTLTIELHIPDRSREDVAFLAAVCAREFAKKNFAALPELATAIASIQFVADLTRVLLLEGSSSPTSPRKVWRVLTALAIRVRQFGLNTADDCSALLRIDGLCRLVPALRQHQNELRVALETNRIEKFVLVLGRCPVDAVRSEQARIFFLNTRLMQPSLRDGWFRLLGGFATKPELQQQLHPALKIDWEIKCGNLDFYRYFVESVELDAHGYAHDLILRYLNPAHSPSSAGFEFEIHGGYREKLFIADDLPTSFQNPTADFYGQCWLVWSCLLATSPAEMKLSLFARAFRWLESIPDALQADFRDLFWRECLADAEFWEDLTEPSWQIWWQKAKSDSSKTDNVGRHWIPIRRFFALPLANGHFAEAWWILGRPGKTPRDSRSAINWWGHLVPSIGRANIEELPNEDTLFGSKIWPPPKPKSFDSDAWHKVLKQHFTCLNVLNAIQRHIIPPPLDDAWHQAQEVLRLSHFLDLIYVLGYDDKADLGLRWSLKAVRPWLIGINPRLYNEISKRIDQTDASMDLNTEQRLSLILIAIINDTKPNDLSALTAEISVDILKEFTDELKYMEGVPEWLAEIS